MKRDGHTHTHYCLHASGEATEEFVQKAIAEGFTMYSFTEHLPLAEDFLREFPYSEEIKGEFALRNDDLDGYFRDMYALKKKYQDRIELLVGLEIDYMPGQESYLRMMLKEYGSFIEDALLSVHTIKGRNAFRCVDLDPVDFEEGLVSYYGSYENVQLAYYQTVREALVADLGKYKPKRISHLTLCNKFQHYFGQAERVGEKVKATVLELLNYMQEHGYCLDANMAGLFKEYCREAYPAPWVIRAARQCQIPLIYGSDSHAVENVGRGYDQYLQLIGK